MGIIDDDKAVNQALEEVEELRAALAAMQKERDEAEILVGVLSKGHKIVLDGLESALAAMTDRADAESLRAERAEETALKLKPMWDDYGILIKDKERLEAKLEAVEADAYQKQLDLAAKDMEIHALQVKLEAVEAIVADIK